MKYEYYKIITTEYLPWIDNRTWNSLEDIKKELDSLKLENRKWFVEKVTEERIRITKDELTSS